MPNAYLNKLAEDKGFKSEVLEQAWEKAKNIASNRFTEEDDGLYPYTTGIFKRMLSLSRHPQSKMVLERMPKVTNTEGFKDVLRKLSFT